MSGRPPDVSELSENPSDDTSINNSHKSNLAYAPDDQNNIPKEKSTKIIKSTSTKKLTEDEKLSLMTARRRDVPVIFQQINPKKNHSKSRDRYEVYKKAINIEDAISKYGATMTDIQNDFMRGFLRVQGLDNPTHIGKSKSPSSNVIIFKDKKTKGTQLTKTQVAQQKGKHKGRKVNEEQRPVDEKIERTWNKKHGMMGWEMNRPMPDRKA